MKILANIMLYRCYILNIFSYTKDLQQTLQSNLVVVLFCLTPTVSIASQILYVNQHNPNGSDIGDGTKTRPFLTLGAAISKIMPGDTIIIADGVYRESIILPERKWSEDIRTQIIAANPGNVLIMGSDIVRGWKKIRPSEYIKNGWEINSQQVFVDGTPLTQIEGTIFNGFPEDTNHQLHAHHKRNTIWPARITRKTGSLPNNSFYYDRDKKNLHINITPSKNINTMKVEVSLRTYLLFAQNTHGLLIRGIKFQHANTSSKSRAGAITLRGNNIIIDNIEITKVDSVGLNLSGNNNIIRNSTMNYCGQLGMKIRGDNIKIEHNTTNYNNTRGFNKWWEAGGVKFVGSNVSNVQFVGHKSYFNKGDGIWFDWGNSNVEIKNSISAYNSGHGIHYEASLAGHIENNYIYANNQRGIYLPHSSHSTIAHNLVAFNNLEGIVIIDEGREDPKAELDLRPRNNKVIGNILAWNNSKKTSLILPADLLDNRSDYNLYITKTPPNFSLGWPSNALLIRRMGLSAWTRVSGQDAHSWSSKNIPSKELLNAIRKKVQDIDWASLLITAKEYYIADKTLDINANHHPGPSKP